MDAATDCFNCRFWNHLEAEMGQCRRYAPRAVQWGETANADGDRGDDTVVWPLVAEDEWCGEFEAK